MINEVTSARCPKCAVGIGRKLLGVCLGDKPSVAVIRCMQCNHEVGADVLSSGDVEAVMAQVEKRWGDFEQRTVRTNAERLSVHVLRDAGIPIPDDVPGHTMVDMPSLLITYIRPRV